MTSIFFQSLPQANTFSKVCCNKANTPQNTRAAHNSWKALQECIFLPQLQAVNSVCCSYEEACLNPGSFGWGHRKKSNKALGGRKWPDLRKAERRQKKMYRRSGTFLGKGGTGAWSEDPQDCRVRNQRGNHLLHFDWPCLKAAVSCVLFLVANARAGLAGLDLHVIYQQTTPRTGSLPSGPLCAGSWTWGLGRQHRICTFQLHVCLSVDIFQLHFCGLHFNTIKTVLS